MVEDINKYMKDNGIEKQKTVEETITLVLEHLSKNKRNSMNVSYKSELITSASVLLNGITKFKNPLRVYESFGRAMDRRCFCAFPSTVVNAFARAYQEAAKQGKEKKALSIWKSFDNKLVKSSAARFVPREDFLSFLRTSNGACQRIMSKHFKFRNDIGVFDIERVLNNNFKNAEKNINCAKAILRHKNSSKEQKENAQRIIENNKMIKKRVIAPLKYIHGKRKQRTEIMNMRTRNLRK